MTRPRRRTAWRGATILGCTIVSSSCGFVLGVNEYRVAPAQDKAPDASPIRYASPECEQCMTDVTDGCATELDACEGNKSCAAYARCHLGCEATDGECLYNCLGEVSGKISQASDLVACEIRACWRQCGSCGSTFTGITPTCGSCAIADPGPTGLCELTNQCLDELECNGFIACLAKESKRLGLSDPGTRLACGSRYPDAARRFYQQVGVRYFFGCTVACSAGQDWDCTQPTAWPAAGPAGSRANVTLHVTVPLVAPPNSAVTVRACRGDDYACTSPIGKPRDSDANEVVVFELDQSNSEQSYYFEFYLPGSSNPYFIYVPWQPLVGDIALWVPGPIDPAPLYATAEQRSEQPISGRALVAVNVADCVGGNADFLSANPMITFSGPPSILPYYTNRNGAIDAQATGGGFGHFMNVPPGSFSFRVERGESRDLVASAIVPVRADVETRVHFNYPQYY